MKQELIDALVQLEREKGISKDTLIETIEAALITAYKKNFPDSLDVRVTIDQENGDVRVYSRTTVVEEYVEDIDEILLEEAQEINPDYQIGDVIEKESRYQHCERYTREYGALQVARGPRRTAVHR